MKTHKLNIFLRPMPEKAGREIVVEGFDVNGEPTLLVQKHFEKLEVDSPDDAMTEVNDVLTTDVTKFLTDKAKGEKKKVKK